MQEPDPPETTPREHVVTPSVSMPTDGDLAPPPPPPGVTLHPSGLNRAQRRALYRQHRRR